MTDHAEEGEAGKVGLQNITCVHRGNPVFSKPPLACLYYF
jgi:hypothetical protein